MNISPNLIVKQSNVDRAGVFTTVDVKAGQTILEFGGTKLNAQQIQLENVAPDHYLQIGADLYLTLSGSIDDLINHSCSPNSAVNVRAERAFLVAIFDIAADSELTFDYSLTSTERPDQWTMKCKCGSYSCRKQISGYTSLSETVKQYYKQIGSKVGDITAPMIPKYVEGK